MAQKDLNWSTPNARLYNEAYIGHAKVISRCPHCLCEDHVGASCPHNPNPMLVGWFPDPCQLAPLPNSAQLFPPSFRGAGAAHQEVCRNYNDNCCRFSRCLFQHVCQECFGPHPSMFCPGRATTVTGGRPFSRLLFGLGPSGPTTPTCTRAAP